MAHDWIKMRVDLADDPAVIGIAAATGLDEFAVVGRLHAIWSWADKHLTDGNARGVTLAWLDRYARAAAFGEAMVAQGWLEVTDVGIVFPKFDRHNTQTGKERALASNRAAKHRAKSNADRNGVRHAPSVTEGAPTQHNTTEDPPPPTPACSAGWAAVEESLHLAGVAAAAAAIAAAQARGSTAEEVQQLVQHFNSRPGAWGAGALHDVVAGKLSDWPPPAAAFQAEADRRNSEQHTLDLRRQRDADLAQQQQAEAEAAELEAAHGATLDAMPTEQLQAQFQLLDSSGRDWRAHMRRRAGGGRMLPAVRLDLLRSLAAQPT